ncbi:MAG TPA: TetR/AcrR family transcriptional regulator [Verrucomicrobiales bacterium]|nr:TetR/AcrR family transcriptional regulator [Verrucomicrobiales bacterium]
MARTSDARERLLEAALELIWTSSYGAVSVDDICERAGVKKGSFYHFFESKAELALQAYDAHWSEIQTKLDAVFSPQTPPLARLENWCQAVYEDQKQRFLESGRVCGCPFANVGSELSTLDERLRRKSLEMLERGSRYLESAVAEGVRLGQIPAVDPKAAAHEIYALFMGQMLQAKLANNPETLRDLGPQVLKLLRSRAVA